MRIFKFRAWHAEDKVMIYDLNTPRLFHGVLQPDDYVLMQFTGLLDKNGKEIYEGDIVKTNDCFTDKRESFGKVGFGKYEDDEQYSTWYHQGFYVKFVDDDLKQSLYKYNLEVIGNIYENPDLINR